MTTDSAVIGPLLLLVETSIPQLRAVNAAVERFDAEIASLCPKLPDYELFDSLPGAGPALAPRLLVAFGERRERFSDAASLQKYVGVAPVTERSGNMRWGHWRFVCPTFQRQTFIEWVGQTVPRSFWAKAFYQSYHERGGSHQGALRALAFAAKASDINVTFSLAIRLRASVMQLYATGRARVASHSVNTSRDIFRDATANTVRSCSSTDSRTLSAKNARSGSPPMDSHLCCRLAA